MSFDPIDHDFERGLQNRRTMLGDDWVDRSLNKATSVNADFQNLITRFTWNEIWGRPGLDHETRRAIVLSMTIALGRGEEFELRPRAALLGEEDSRLSPDGIKEILMQSAIYAGVPAANTAFTHTLAILREVGEQIGYVLEPAAPAASAHAGIGRARRTASSPVLHYSVREPRNGRAPRHTVVLSQRAGLRPDDAGRAGQRPRAGESRHRLRSSRPWRFGRARRAVCDGGPGRRRRACCANSIPGR